LCQGSHCKNLGESNLQEVSWTENARWRRLALDTRAGNSGGKNRNCHQDGRVGSYCQEGGIDGDSGCLTAPETEKHAEERRMDTVIKVAKTLRRFVHHQEGRVAKRIHRGKGKGQACHRVLILGDFSRAAIGRLAA